MAGVVIECDDTAAAELWRPHSYVKQCTNCIRITLAEARERGGVACKICGGSCR